MMLLRGRPIRAWVSHWIGWRFLAPQQLLGYRLSYWLAIWAGWRHSWRGCRPGMRFWTVERGGVRRVECTFKWRDLWDKPALRTCTNCGRKEGQYHHRLCANQTILHPDGERV